MSDPFLLGALLGLVALLAVLAGVLGYLLATAEKRWYARIAAERRDADARLKETRRDLVCQLLAERATQGAAALATLDRAEPGKPRPAPPPDLLDPGTQAAIGGIMPPGLSAAARGREKSSG